MTRRRNVPARRLAREAEERMGIRPTRKPTTTEEPEMELFTVVGSGTYDAATDALDLTPQPADRLLYSLSWTMDDPDDESSYHMSVSEQAWEEVRREQPEAPF